MINNCYWPKLIQRRRTQRTIINRKYIKWIMIIEKGNRIQKKKNVAKERKREGTQTQEIRNISAPVIDPALRYRSLSTKIPEYKRRRRGSPPFSFFFVCLFYLIYFCSIFFFLRFCFSLSFVFSILEIIFIFWKSICIESWIISFVFLPIEFNSAKGGGAEGGGWGRVGYHLNCCWCVLPVEFLANSCSIK